MTRTHRTRWYRAAAGLALALPVWALVEPARLVVVERELRLPGWPTGLTGLRVAVLADLHTGSPWTGLDKIARVVRRTNEQRPDLIVLLGDYVVHGVIGGSFVEPADTAKALRHLAAPLGVLAVLGNHDWWHDGAQVRAAFEAEGIRVLENETARVARRGIPLFIAGLADLWTRTPDIQKVLRDVPAASPVIVLTHSPDVFPAIPPRVALTLAGHTHGGQVALPLLGRLVVPSAYRQRYAYGHIFEDGRQMFVSSGIGTSILPVRFRVPPEIVILTLRP